MYNFAICDDNLDTLSYIEALVRAFFDKHDIFVSFKKFDNGEDLADAIKVELFDVIFLDIEMPEINGIETAELIRASDKSVKIIFITDYPVYALDSFIVKPFGYIVKTTLNEDIEAELSRLMEYGVGRRKPEFIYIRTTVGRIKFNVDDIVYAQINLRRREIVTTDATHKTTLSMAELQSMFKVFDFGMPHKSFIVNFGHINKIYKDMVYVSSDIKLPLADRKAPEFRLAYNKYLNRKLR